MIIHFSQLAKIRKKFSYKKIVFAGGVFDLSHSGHIDSIKNLMKYGDIVVVAVSTDKRVKERKGPKRPILSQQERVHLVDAIRYVDYALIAPESTIKNPIPTMKILQVLRPDNFVTIDRRFLLYKKQIKGLGIKLHIFSRMKVNSTTHIIKNILKKYRKELPIRNSARRKMKVQENGEKRISIK